MPESTTLSTLIEIRRSAMDPRLTPGERYYYYSLPAFDATGQPEITLGSQIDSSKFLVDVGDILISKLNPRIKRVWKVDNDRRHRSISSTEFVDVVPKHLENRDFVYHLLGADQVYRQLERTAEGTTNSHVRFRPGFLHSIVLGELPPAQSWQRIAEIISAIDEALDQTKALIAKTQQIKAGLMHDLFTRGVTGVGQLRPPREEAPKLYKESPLGWIPKEWESSELRQLASLVTSGSRGWAAYYTSVGALFVRSQNVRMGHLDFTDRQCVTPPRGSEGQRTQLCANDLLVTITGNSVGNVAFVPDNWTEIAFVSQHVGLVRLHEPGLAELAMNYLAPGSPGNQQLLDAQYGQSKPGLNLDNLRCLRVPIPAEDERVAIVERISTARGRLEYEADYAGYLQALKAGLMHDLLTGHVRVPVAEIREATQ